MAEKKAVVSGKISDKELEIYLEGQPEDIKKLFYGFRKFILDSDKKFAEAIKWNNPCYFIGDKMIHYLFANKKHLTFGFWEGSLLDDPDGLLEGTGKKMRHVKIFSIEEIKNKKLLKLMKEANKRA